MASGSSGGSMLATLDCETVVLGSNPAISPAYTVDCESLDGLPSGVALPCRLSSEGREEEKINYWDFCSPKNN
jgi:hypothetical protein